MEHFLEWLEHAVVDTLPMLPWIFVMYVIIQLLENKTALKNADRFGGKLGPVIGSATGLIPQCGFSVMAAKFYEKKYITLGTLLAIFFSTSDEAFILLLSSGEGALWVLPTLIVKVGLGTAVGYGVDLALKLLGRKQVRLEMPKEEEGEPATTHDIFLQRYLEEKEVDVVCACGKAHGTDSAWKKYLLYPLLHTLQVAAFIFLVNFALTAIIHSVGEDTFSAFMHRNRFLQPFITCAIGLIPNCASSVVITETFLSGGITFGSFVAGLCANAGMGFVVLLKNVRMWKRNLALIGVSYGLSVIVGLLFNLFPLTV
ncbi:MAG: arsenic efflux protein [Clostridia bacterium]|nr:arsenic efflux protein [Clostridia bacterium]